MQQRARGRVGRDLVAAGITPGRNDPCRCGSGKKYKRCHLAADERRATEHQPPEAGG
ncbi:MAG: SEC-C domain-containing protein [Chloroflexi bacterium]|nr:SEC-C domain-containing protein [Chloroflexota bacterium]